MFALIARSSKYDFWIPGGILTLEIKIQKNFFFRAKIVSGIQKSYLEHRAMNANMLKMQILNLAVIENSPKT